MQLLHQAACTGIDWCLFLIGGKNGEIIRGMWIKFPVDIIDTYILVVYAKYDSFTFKYSLVQFICFFLVNITKMSALEIFVMLEKPRRIELLSIFLQFFKLFEISKKELITGDKSFLKKRKI